MRIAAVVLPVVLVAVARATSGSAPPPLPPWEAGGAEPAPSPVPAAASGPPASARSTLEFPRAAAPLSIEIPRIGVRSDLVEVGLDRDGAIEVPSPTRAAWYRGSVAPGEIGPSIVVGHVDSRSGPAVFFRLRELATGDSIAVADDSGETRWFEVSGVATYEKESVPASVYGITAVPTLRLVTCGGPFRAGSGYRDNVIVTAVLR